jgi:hypothetical protein
MKTKTLNIFCFLIPYVITVFNLQVFVTRLISNSLAQLIAYGNIALLLIGIIITLKKSGEFSKTARLWIVYYITYFAFATLGSALNDNPAQILVNIIPFIYILAFYVYLSIPKNRKIFRKVTLISFTVSSILCILFFKINFDLDHNGIYIYKLDRAEGVFGDANNAALVAILSYVFIFKLYNPIKRFHKYFKIILLLTMFYCLFLTFSTTGLLVFVIINIMLNQKLFSPKRILLVLFMIPFFYIAILNINSLTAGLNLRPHQQMKINNIVNILTLNTREVDDSGRNELVANLLNYVYENPFIGNGIGFAISQRGHNTIVGVWADAGIFTLLIFFIMLITYFKNSIIAPPNIRFFALPILITMCVFMLSLQSVINQPYLMALFVYIGYIIDEKTLV